MNETQKNQRKQPIRRWISLIVLCVCLAAMLISSLIGKSIASSGGSVKIEDIEFTTDTGAKSHAKLYIPNEASEENKLPAVLLCHGYTASLDAMEPNAIELSRRGYVVMALDMYGHGESSLPESTASQAEMGNIAGYAPDLGSYTALQELGKLPYVDTTSIGMLGHSMGTAAIQEGAYIAYAKWQNAYTAAYEEAVAGGMEETEAVTAANAAAYAENITLPRTLVLTGYNYNVRNAGDLTYNGVTADNGVFPLYAAPVNIATIYGEYDEFSSLLWGVDKAADYMDSFKFAYGTGGAQNVELGTFFLYGDQTASPLSREEAVEVAAQFGQKGVLRAAYSYPHTHSFAYYSKLPLSQGIEFFDVTLRGGNTTIAPEEQVWQGRAVCGLIGLVSAFIGFAALALTLLEIPFFKTIVRKVPESMSVIKTPKSAVLYIVFYIIFLLPAPLLYNWLVGYPYYMQPQSFIFLTKFMPNSFFNMAPGNSLMLLNIVLCCIYLVLYTVIFVFIAKKAGYTLENTGLKLPVKQVGKSALLAVLAFGGIYAFIYLCHAVSGTYFSFFKFNIMPMNGERWTAFFKYLPVWLLFGLLCSVLQNSLTRIQNTKAWVNYVLIIFVSAGGLMIFHAIDLGTLFSEGVRAFPTIPGTTSEEWLAAIGMSFPTALAGIMLFGLLVILPVSSVISHILFKKTGSVWCGGILASLVTMVFTFSHMVISM